MITRATLIAAYELLRCTPLFLGWKLPNSGEIEFEVIQGFPFGHGPMSARIYADCDGDKIRVARNRHGHLGTLLATMAHEMIHLHQFRNKLDTSSVHNADFRKRALHVCRLHGFDPKVF